jgi:hypothetical protein
MDGNNANFNAGGQPQMEEELNEKIKWFADYLDQVIIFLFSLLETPFWVCLFVFLFFFSYCYLFLLFNFSFSS